MKPTKLIKTYHLLLLILCLTFSLNSFASPPNGFGPPGGDRRGKPKPKPSPNNNQNILDMLKTMNQKDEDKDKNGPQSQQVNLLFEEATYENFAPQEETQVVDKKFLEP